MGILSNTASIYQYTIEGDLPSHEFDEWAAKNLNQNRFTPIDDVPDEISTGWVQLHDPRKSDFSTHSAFIFENYLAFSLRRDQRKVPSSLLKNLVDQECERWLDLRPKLSRVPVKSRMEIRENAHASLLARTLPTPATYDVVWNIKTGIVTLASISSTVLDILEDEFSNTFEGLSLEAIHPMARAGRVLDDEHRDDLAQMNKAPTRDVLTQIKENKWLGWDFLQWLMYRTSIASSFYEVNQPGPAEMKEPFVAYLHDRFVLVNDREESLRKSTFIGPHNNFSEARQAIKNGKSIIEGLLFFERQDQQWFLNLKAEEFAFGSFKCPKVQIERDELTDPASERQAVFFERMSLLETGLQLFDSLLAAFLKERLFGNWPKLSQSINTWLNE